MEQAGGLKFNKASAAGRGFTRGLLQLQCHGVQMA
jgi:hypothetical protein